MNKTRPKWDATRNLIYLSGLPVGYLIMVKLWEMGLPNLVTLLIGIVGIIVWWVLFFALQDKFLSSHKRRFAQENEEIRRAYHESGDAQAFYEALQNRKEQPKTQEERVVQQINLSTALNNLGQYQQALEVLDTLLPDNPKLRQVVENQRQEIQKNWQGALH